MPFRFLVALAAPLSLCASPVHFEPNRGQAAPAVLYLARGGSQAAAFTADGAVFGAGGARVRMTLEGSRRGAIEPVSPLPGRSNYFIGADPGRWRAGAPHFGGLRYRGVYPGIELLFHGAGGALEYDFRVAPRANPAAIRVRFPGASRVALENGELVVRAGECELRHHRPVAYQETAAGRRYVEARYRLRDGVASFEIDVYDRSLPLVIDPVLTYATYLGGSGVDAATAVAADSAGNAFVAGYTNSTDFPGAGARSGSSMAGFVSKLDPTGAHIAWSTYIAGSTDTCIMAMALDSSGNAVVAGYAQPSATCQPTEDANAAASPTGFVIKLNASGGVLFNSVFTAYALGLALDASGAIYVTGQAGASFQSTAGAAQTAVNGPWDAFVLKLAANGASTVYASFLGGSAEDRGWAIAVDSFGYAYVTGDTASADFPGAAPGSFGGRWTDIDGDWFGDAFVARLDPTGARVVYGAYLGGTAPDRGRAIAVDSAGNAYVAGGTMSSDFPVTAGVYQATYAGPAFDPTDPDVDGDAFVARFGSSGALLWATYLGGSDYDMGEAIALDAAGNVYVAGAAGVGFPKTAGAIPECRIGVGGPFVAELDPTGARLAFSTGLSGMGLDDSHAIAVTPAGDSALVAGETISRVFLATAGAAQTAYGGGDSDAMLARLDLTSAPQLALGCLLNGGSLRAGNLASYWLGTVAPGEIVSLFGVGLGPDQPLDPQPSLTQLYPTLLGGASVLFDGVPAPLLYAGPYQINAVVPYAVKAPVTQVTVQRGNLTNGPWTVPVGGAVPAVFSLNGSGIGPGAVLNQDYSVNSTAMPASRGDVIMIYMTGVGLLTPPMVDGSLAPITTNEPQPVLNVSVTIAGFNAPVWWVGAAPGNVSGLIQVNAQIPDAVGFGDSLPLQVQIGDYASQPEIWIAVKQ
jgi:uncharacterized protein (TIGR03437 family)